MIQFDPEIHLESFRQHGIVELEQPVEQLTSTQRNRAAAFAVNAIIPLWIAGLDEELHPMLERAIDWFERNGLEQLESEDPEEAFALRRRYRAWAVAEWLRGDDDSHLWNLAAAASRSVRLYGDEEELADKVPFGSAVVAPPRAMEAESWLADLERCPEGETQVTVGDVGQFLWQFGRELIERGAFVQLASWLRFATAGISADPEFAHAALAILVPVTQVGSAHMPGREDLCQDEAIVIFDDGGDFDLVQSHLWLVGLSRNKDAIPQGDNPEFASWTRHPDLSLEVDWHAPAGQYPYLEIRGKGAGRLAAFLKEALGGSARPGPEAALTELLTVPPRAAPASEVAAEVRWETLCVAVASEGAFHDLPGRALVSASLADSDWRVRMVALWAVGHHRITGLAEKAKAAALPKLGYKGLSQDDRRVLLAMRDLAAARSSGRSDVIKPSANEGFVAKVASLIDAVPEHAESRAEALVKALLRRHVAEGDAPIPSAWKSWMGAPSF